MKINVLMNSISDPHLNQRIARFKEDGHEVRLYGFDRCIETKSRGDVLVIGTFTNNMSYRKRIKIYLNSIRNLFKSGIDNSGIWYYQGLDVAMFATFLNPNKRYVYEECDLVHTNVGNRVLRYVLETLDKRIIRRSLKTIFTSEGFVEYHFGSEKNIPDNCVLVPNRLSSEIWKKEKLDVVEKAFDPSHIRFAFVGGLRYKALVNIASVISKTYPNHEFHFYGFVSPTLSENILPKGTNVFYHGAFKNPDDLFDIYASVDVLVSTYDVVSPNVRYAEPNKLYESIFFRCPIVVSSGTFLERKVKRLEIGYSVDPFSEEDINRLVKEIECSYIDKKSVIGKIDKTEAVDKNSIGNVIKSIK